MNTVNYTLRAAALVIGILAVHMPATDSAAEIGETIPNQAICKLYTWGNFQDIVDGTGMIYLDDIPGQYIYLCEYPASVPFPEMQAIVMQYGEVAYFEPNFIAATPEAQQVSQAFYDARSEQYVARETPAQYFAQPNADQLDWESAHSFATGSNSIVAVIDGGFDLGHPALIGRIVSQGFDFLDEDDDVSEAPGGSSSGHGTFVAGLIALAAPGVGIIPYRTLDTSGVGTSFAVAQAVYDAVAQDVDAINLSLALPIPEFTVSGAVNFANASGVVTVAAAGNSAVSDPQYPAAIPATIAVGAVDSADIVAGFTNFGTWLDVTAPGELIYGPLVDTLFGHWSGTSFATAFVSAEVALLKEARPAAPIDSIVIGVNESAVDIDALNPTYAGMIGEGRIDPLAALLRWTAPSGDVNQDGVSNVLDVIAVIDHVFRSGPPPAQQEWGDCDCNDEISSTDVITLIDYVFRSGAEPCRFLVP